MSTENDETAGEAETNSPMGGRRVGPYEESITEYLDAADWLTALDGPLKVHARQLARSLDQQLWRDGAIQSALASSFDKALMRLERRRPEPEGPHPTLTDAGPHNEESIFSLDLD